MFYEVDSSHNVLEFISIGDALRKISSNCRKSDFDALKNESINSIEVEEDSGEIWQDFIYEKGIPLVSEKFKIVLDEQGIDYLFYKKVILKKKNIEKNYWLALPPKIDCLDKNESEIDEIMGCADYISIDSSKIKDFKIFKIKGITNVNIIITEKFAQILRSQNFIGLHIFELNS